MDPKIIPFGWGLFRDDDEVLVIERGGAKRNMITIISKTHTKINKKKVILSLGLPRTSLV